MLPRYLTPQANGALLISFILLKISSTEIELLLRVFLYFDVLIVYGIESCNLGYKS